MTEQKSTIERRPGFWAGILFAAYGVVAALQMTGAVEGPASIILYFLPLAFVWPLYNSAQAYQRQTGTNSSAVALYNKRFFIAMLAYMAGLGIAIVIFNRGQISVGAAAGLALLPAIPVLGMIWTMTRYILDETDEYLRFRAIMASLSGLGVLLALASVWGFLELFGAVPHAPSWFAFPIWAAGMGLAQCWMAIRARSSNADGNGA